MEKFMNTYLRAMVAGFIATVVLSILMIVKSMMGIMPALDPVHMLSSVAHERMGMPDTPMVGWVIHFMIGTVLWGALFALLYKSLPGKSPLVKGLVFSVFAWLLMMVIPMPMSGAGLFGMDLGMMAPVMTLMLHLIWGAVFGGSYGALEKSAASH
jgi:hypothetical protein